VYRIVFLRIRCGPRIIPYGVNVLIPAPYRSRGWGCRSGWPSYSHRPASIDPPGTLSIAVTLSRLRSHRSERFDGQRLTALRVTDRPRLIGWSSLDPTCYRSLTSLCRRHRHRLAGSRTDRKLARPAPCGACLALTCATKTTTPAVPCGPSSATIETPSVVPRKTGLPRSPHPCLPSCWKTSHERAHRSHLGVAAACVSTSSGNLLGQRHAARVALRLLDRRDARCVGPTSAISRPRTSTRASLVLGASSACAPSRPRRSPDSTSVRFASVGHTFPCGSRRARRCPPVVTRANSTSDTPVASPSRSTTLARCLPLESRQGRRQFARVNDANRQMPRSTFHQARAFAPQRPFERPARAFSFDRGLATAVEVIDTFSLPTCLAKRWEPAPRPRAPLPTGVALLWISVSLADFCNL
jgi:hypothetical protein